MKPQKNVSGFTLVELLVVIAIIGTLIGLLSAMMGVGGGSLGGMTMSLCGRPIHQAVATASGFGIAIGPRPPWASPCSAGARRGDRPSPSAM